MTTDSRVAADEAPPTYRMLLADGVWRRWTLAVAGTRLPIAMAPLALVYIGHVATGSYGVGSVMASAYSFAEAFSAPGTARLLSRSGRDLRRGVALVLGVGALFMLALALFSQLKAPAVLLVVLAALSGGIPSSAQGGMRAMLQQLVPERLREKAFALDATLLEVQWAAAPALVALTVSLGAAPLAVVIMALAAVISGGLVFTLPATPASALQEEAAADSTEAAETTDRPARRAPAWRANKYKINK